MTVMRLVVSVPVLSLQMVVALPMVSHASRCFTRLLSSCIFCTENARESVTASGRPSGTATTRMVMPVMKKPSSLGACSHCRLSPAMYRSREKRPAITSTHTAATTVPAYPICIASNSSLACSTDCTSSSSSSPSSFSFPWPVTRVLMMPAWELGPTATTTMEQLPSITLVPDSRKGVSVLFLMKSVSPVMALSSHFRSWPSRNTPSAGMMSPTFSSTMSPTQRVMTDTSFWCPPRMTLTEMSFTCSFSLRNCFSFA
mmetsp:Transcript_10095/g.25249  ORF Transcript_10095/g.25249 Transcript_10095/m.25249 type:complete len:257 (-) Transcript_10095:515-1285(-)